MIRFDRFTERAQDAAARAYEILHRYGHSQVDTEHILMALLEQTDGVVPQILERLAVDIGPLRSRVDEDLRKRRSKVRILGRGNDQHYISANLMSAIDRATGEANQLRDEYVSSEHIFLALLAERNHDAAIVLAKYGITRDLVANAVEDIRGDQRANGELRHSAAR